MGVSVSVFWLCFIGKSPHVNWERQLRLGTDRVLSFALRLTPTIAPLLVSNLVPSHEHMFDG